MNDRRLSDAQIATALRAHLPAAAQAGLRGRVTEAVEITSQQRPLPSFLGALSDADPAVRQRSLLIAAALLLGMALATGAAVGALRLLQRDTAPKLDLKRPADLQAFVLSTYDRMPEMPPVAITTLTDGSIKGRMYVDRSGAVRFERYATPDTPEPDTYKILSGTSMGELVIVGSDRVWVEQDEALSEDPRVFLLAEMEGNGAGNQPGCGATRNKGEVGNGTAASGWTYVDAEYVAWRPAYHVACAGGDLWIDVETRLILRSRGPVRNESGRPVAGSFRTIEVTGIQFGEQPAELFVIAQPAGVARMSSADYEAYKCTLIPTCSASFASPPPAYTPPPGATPRVLPPLSPSPASNGWIAFVRQPLNAGDGPADIYLVREGVKPRPIVGGDYQHGRNECPSFSPDGTRLAYAEASGPRSDGTWAQQAVVVVSVDASGSRVGSEVRIPIPGPSSAGVPCPQWSPDGRSVAYLNLSDAGYAQVAITRLDGASTVVPAPYNSNWGDFAWSPVGDTIAASENSGIWLTRSDGGEPRLIRAGVPGEFGDLSWSPDGSRIAVTLEDRVSPAGDSVRIIRVDGSAADVDLKPGMRPVWSPSGDRIAYYSGGVVVVDADGSHAHRVPPVAGTADHAGLSLGAAVLWSPDGRRLVCIAYTDPLAYTLVSVSVSGESIPSVLTTPSLDLDAADHLGLSWQPVFP